MADDLPTLTLNATETALLASGRFTFLNQDLVDASAPAVLLVNPFSRPGNPADDAGFLTPNTVAAGLNVVLNADPQRRTVYLFIDRDNAELTGNYVVQIDALTAVTYDATAAAPADVDELLQGIVDAVNADVPTFAIVEADTYSLAGTGVLDSVRLRAKVGSDPNNTRETFIVAAGTSFQPGANMKLVREIDSVDLRVWGRPAMTVPGAVTVGGPCGDMLNAWREIVDLGTIENGLTQQLNVATMQAIWVEFYASSAPADTYDLNATTDWACAYVALSATDPQ